MKHSDTKLWNELFSPPCPKCGGTKTKEELRDIPVVANGAEMFERLKRQMEGKHNPPIRTWKCHDCQTTYDEKGRFVTFESKV